MHGSIGRWRTEFYSKTEQVQIQDIRLDNRDGWIQRMEKLGKIGGGLSPGLNLDRDVFSSVLP